MKTKEVIKSQYYASMAMLRQAIEKCPDSLWWSQEYTNQFWHIAYHAIFYTHLYLHPSEEEYIPWEHHRDEYVSLETPEEGPVQGESCTKEEVLTYHDHCLEQLEGLVDSLDLGSESGFYWLPFNKLELQFYNIRHLQQHTGELSERLGMKGEIEVNWVGAKPDK